ncbi:CocE/NonD family hydrolase [Arthrobacter sp. SA17]
MVLVGVSYLGFVQWAVADQLPPQVKAMIPQVTESALSLEFLREDGMSLELPFEWGVMTAVQERPWAMLRSRRQAKKTARALKMLPLNQADVAAIGHSSKYIQDILAFDAKHEYWADADHSHRVAGVSVPVSSIGGWYDIFLPGQLRDFQTLQDAGRPARLTVGPWTHAQFTNIGVLEAVDFGLAYAKVKFLRSGPRSGCMSWARTSGGTLNPGRRRATHRRNSTCKPTAGCPAWVCPAWVCPVAGCRMGMYPVRRGGRRT